MHDTGQGVHPLLLPPYCWITYNHLCVLGMGTNHLLHPLLHCICSAHSVHLHPGSGLLPSLRCAMEDSEQVVLPRRRGNHYCCYDHQHGARFYHLLTSDLFDLEHPNFQTSEARPLWSLRYGYDVSSSKDPSHLTGAKHGRTCVCGVLRLYYAIKTYYREFVIMILKRRDMLTWVLSHI